MTVLDIRNLAVAFGATPVVHGVDLSIARGEALALVGESGSGKSITAMALMGLLPARASMTADAMELEGQDLRGLSDAALRRLRGPQMGMIFQEPMTSLTPVLTIGRQMTEALRVHFGLSGEAARARAIDMLDRVEISRPADRLRQYPHEFSGGMRQRVMIAMTMALEPRLLIADEPTTALDVTVQAQILDLMRTLVRETGTSLLLITHDMGVVAQMADRVTVMRHGRLVETEAAAPLFAAPRQDYTRILLNSVPRLDAPLRPAPQPTPPVLGFRDISRSFAGRGLLRRSEPVRALDGVTLDIARGETLALVGESGSGKSTLGRIGTRLDLEHDGRVEIDGIDITGLRGRALRKLRSRVQVVFQDPLASLDPRFTVGRTLGEPLRIHQGLAGECLRTRAADLLAQVGLPSSALGRLPHEFSGGQRQRIAIARALAVDPAVIVADEPTSALDVSVQSKVLDLMEDLQRERGLAYLFVTHDLAVVRRIAHRVAVMRRGRIVEMGPVSAVLDDARHPYTQALLAAAPVADPTRARRPPAPMPHTPDKPLSLVSDGHWVAA
ncbi:ABC transporter ATP-binding protein [Mangrovicoccus algicola]|uniref:ABC transporter ATP-binding protein n=1 Tax=Mangrovicoccus algicola TaxID=2771008 RepID=A0A8J6YYK5_9RHOB|nr:ABC transporter ATP-binding protein [Mangrovicoccus algicola]MBE3638123.1 ABC transporter ATP-binding protein [Mangrovicoccus algicola]